MSETESKSSIQVIDRMMKLLDELAVHAEPMSLKQLAQLTSLHPSSAHRILNVMVEKRMVDRIEPGTYQLGIKFLELGNLVKSRINIRQIALPFMQSLNAELGETVNLILRQGDEAVYVERTTGGRSMMRVVQVIGARAPLHITAVGKIFLAEEGPNACETYAQRNGLPAYTENSITNIDDLCKAVQQAKKRGYAFDNEEAEKGVCCIGAGIHDSDRNLIAGLSVSAPTDRLDQAWAKKIKQTADQISKVLGYRPA